MRDLIAGRVPLFEFAVRTTISRFDLDSVSGRMQALRAAAPVVAGIRDRASRPEYARRLAGLLGMPIETVTQAVAAAGREAGGPPTSAVRRVPSAAAESPVGRVQAEARRPRAGPGVPASRRAGPAAAADAQPARSRRRPRAPAAAGRPAGARDRSTPAEFDALGDEAFGTPAYRVAHQAIRAAGGLAPRRPRPGEALGRARGGGRQRAGPAGRHRAGGRPAARARGEDGLARLALSLQVEIAGRDLLRQEAEVHSRMQRLDAAGDAIGYRAALVEAEAIVRRRTALRERLG